MNFFLIYLCVIKPKVTEIKKQTTIEILNDGKTLFIKNVSWANNPKLTKNEKKIFSEVSRLKLFRMRYAGRKNISNNPINIKKPVSLNKNILTSKTIIKQDIITVFLLIFNFIFD